MNLNCKIKFENYLKENNLEDKNNILELFSQLTLEQLAEKLLTLDEDEIVELTDKVDKKKTKIFIK